MIRDQLDAVIVIQTDQIASIAERGHQYWCPDDAIFKDGCTIHMVGGHIYSIALPLTDTLSRLSLNLD